MQRAWHGLYGHPGIVDNWTAHSGLVFSLSFPSALHWAGMGQPFGLKVEWKDISLCVLAPCVRRIRTLLRLRNGAMWPTLLQVRLIDNPILYILFILSKKQSTPEHRALGCKPK